jgi:RND superfamily putative drug exporter
MTLLGRANWAYPRWAERITPRLSVEGPERAPDTHEMMAG